MQPEFFIFLSVYFVLLIFTSFLFLRKMKSLEDFFLASRSLSAFLVYLSLCASWFGATSILVSTDEAYREGLSSFWLVGMPAMLTVLALGFFLAKPLRRLPIVSLPDLVEMRYGPTVRHLASLLIIWYMVLLAASQMVAVGNFLKIFLGTSYFWSLVLGTAVVLLYSICGGFFSVVVADSYKFLLLILGMASLFFFLASHSSFNEIKPLAFGIGKGHYFDFFYNFKTNSLITLSFLLAWTISPIAWQRIQAARTAEKAKRALFAAAGTFFLLYWLVVIIGCFSLPLFSSRKLANPLLSELISSKTGIFLGGLVFVAVVAAVMSTMDAAINTGALTLTRDIYQQLFPSAKAQGIVRASRVSTFLVGAMAFVVATQLQDILKTIGLASEIMAEGLFIPGMAMIFLKRKLPLAGFLSLVLGGGFSIITFLGAVNLLPLSLPSWPFSVPYGLALSMGGFMIGLAFEMAKTKS